MKLRSMASGVALAATLFSFGLVGCGGSSNANVVTVTVGSSVGSVLILGQSTTLTATDVGWYDNTGFNNPSNQNYIVGQGVGPSGEEVFNDFFVFDLSGVSGQVIGAQLNAFNPASPERLQLRRLIDQLDGSLLRERLQSGDKLTRWDVDRRW